MDCTETKVEMAEGGLLEPLVIIEEGDVTKGVTERRAASNSQSCVGESAVTEEEEHAGEDENEASKGAKRCSELQSRERQQTSAGDSLTGEGEVDKQEKDKPEETENMTGGQNRGDGEAEGQNTEVLRINEEPEEAGGAEDEKVPQNVAIERLNPSKRQPEGTKSQEEDPKKVCGLFLFYTGMTLDTNCLFVPDLTNRPPCTLPEKQSCDGKTTGVILLPSMWEYVGVERILLLCQQTVCATHRETFPPSLILSLCHLPVCSQAHRLTPEFPEALYELLCTLQEGRRLNDQRCSFRLESGVRRRRCHSEPNTTKPANRGGSPLK